LRGVQSLKKFKAQPLLFGVALSLNTVKTTPSKERMIIMEEKINQTESKVNKTKKYRTILADPPWGVP